MRRFSILMYHRIVSARCPVPDGYGEEVRYGVNEDAFARQLDAIRESGGEGVSMRQIHDRLAAGETVPETWVGITFDDGNRSDYDHALPMLLDRGFRATFYVCTNRLGAAGGLSGDEVRSMHESGMHIGAHGVTHRFLTSLDSADEEQELRTSRDVLTDLIGTPVDHFAPPGGRYSGRTLRHLDALDYVATATSDVGLNACTGTRRLYRRIAVMNGTSLDAFRRLISGSRSAILPEYARWMSLRFARGILGEGGYRRLRSMGTGD